MKIFFIILAVIVSIVVIWHLIVSLVDKEAANNVKGIDPLVWISTNSFMGFQLLDDWEFTLSRMHHLGMLSSMDLGEQKLAYQASSKETFTFKTTINNLKHIDHISFEIFEGKLYAIHITLKVEGGESMYEFKKSLYDMYNKAFGKATRIMTGYKYDGIDGSFLVLSLDFDTLRVGMPHSIKKNQVMPDIGRSYVVSENGEPLVTYYHSGFYFNMPLSASDKPYFLNIRRPIILDNSDGNLKLPQLPDECDGLIINNMGSPFAKAFYVKDRDKQSMYCG